MARPSLYSVLLAAWWAAPPLAVAQLGAIPLTLAEAERLAMARSPVLAASQAEGAALLANAQAGLSFANPTLSLTREAVRDGARRGGETYLTAQQLLPWPAHRSARGAAVSATSEVWSAAFALAEAEVRHAVRTAWLDAWLAGERRAVQARVSALVRSVRERGLARHAAGDLSGMDRRRLELELVRHERLLADARQAELAGWLALTIQVFPEDSTRLVAPADLEGVPGRTESGVAGFAAVGHPRARLAAAEVTLAEAEARVQRSLRLSGPALTAGFKSQDDGFRGILLGVGLPLPILDRRAPLVEAANQRAAAAGVRLAQVVREVGGARALAERRLSAADSLFRAFGAATEAGTEPDLLAIAEVAWDEGEIDLFDLLATADAWRELGLQEAALRADLWAAWFAFELGRGTPVQLDASTRERGS